MAEAGAFPFCRRLEGRVAGFIRRHGLLEPGEGVLAGVSGGPDSLALLFILARRRRLLRLELAVAYFDHGLRGAQGQEEAAFVAALAQELGLPFVGGRGDVRAHARAQGLSLEAAARELRYSFLGQEAARLGLGLVAVGHTASDQAETVLLHLLRGSGTEGLAAMAPRSPWPWQGPGPPRIRGPHVLPGKDVGWLLRPLLAVSRAETEAYCRELGLAPRGDPTNLLWEPLRNRIRHELLPLLRRYNPRIEAALCRLAEAAAQDRELLEGEAQRRWPGLMVEGEGELRLRRQELAALPAALRRRLLAQALRRLAAQASPTQAHLEALEGALAKGAGTSLSLPGGLVATAEPPFLILRRATADPEPIPETPIPVPGEAQAGPWLVRTEVVEREVPTPVGTGGLGAEDGWAPALGHDPWQAYLDLEALGGPLVVRSRRPGDRFQPLGMAQAKKLQDFFVDAKAPRRQRDETPLVCAPWGIAWVVGHRPAEWARVTPQSRRLLHLAFSRQEAP